MAKPLAAKVHTKVPIDPRDVYIAELEAKVQSLTVKLASRAAKAKSTKTSK